MSRPLRNTDPSKIHLITTRTVDAALWMVPSANLNALLGGILARYQETFSIVIYAFIFTGNHYHMLVRAPLGHLDEFAENVNREIARRVNWLNGRQSKFWGRRYDDQVVLSDEDAIEAFLYIVTNPTKHGLIPHPNSYPGLSCYAQALDGQPRRFEFEHYRFRKFGKEVKTHHFLTLSPLPELADLAPKDRKRRIIQLVDDRVKKLAEARLKEGKRFGSSSMLRKQRAGTLPKVVSRSSRPLGYSKDPALIREFKESDSWLRARYYEASWRYRAGETDVQFPAFTFKPPLHRKPRSFPFGHLKKEAA